MGIVVPRTVTLLNKVGEWSPSRRLANFRADPAYVLLGDPGSGKTTTLRDEADRTGGHFVTARRFLRGKVDRHPEWQGTTLFIDGLDEVRAGGGDPRSPLDGLLKKLERLGNPRVRISCRVADWLGRNDEREVASLAGYEDLKLLRLNPLREDDVHKILSRHQIHDADDFLRRARDHGLDDLLRNPLCLELIAKVVVKGKEWPRSRLEMFTQACRKLAREHNDEHCAAQRSLPALGIEEVMTAAGQLSALLLLSGKGSFSQDPVEDEDCVVLEDIRDADIGASRRVLTTKLFASKDQRLAPVHRHIGEFLAARYLSRKIKEGVPANRVLALMTGHDGVVVFDLRGLSAWLAALNPKARQRLIATDPIGMVLYGDVKSFAQDEKERLLDKLEEQPGRLDPWFWPSLTCRSLVSTKTVETLRRFTTEPDRSDGRQRVTYLLIRGMAEAEHSLSVAELCDVVRDDSWWLTVRKAGLRTALIRAKGRDSSGSLKALLNEIRDGCVLDSDNTLGGMLLQAFYPADVTPEQLWDYFPRTVSSEVSGASGYWYQRTMQKADDDDLPALLDGWSKLSVQRKDYVHNYLGLGREVVKLLVRGLEAHGNKTEVSKLYDWIRSAFDLDGEQRPQGWEAVHAWLAEHFDLGFELLLEGIHRHSRTGYSHWRAWQLRKTFFGYAEPPSFASWCLDQAVAMVESNEDAALGLLQWSVEHHSKSALDSWLTEARHRVQSIPLLAQHLERLVAPVEPSPLEKRDRREQESYTEKKQREREEYLAYVRKHAEDLALGTCAPKLLHHLGRVYLDTGHGDQEDPGQRLRQDLDRVPDLVASALSGLGRTLKRPDLPDLSRIISLNKDNQMSLLAYPVLAGLMEMDRQRANVLRGLDDAGILGSLGFYYTTPLYLEDVPPWYLAFVESRPELVAEALVKVYRSFIRRRRDNTSHLYVMVGDKRFRKVARIAVPQLLQAFPTRCTKPQISTLHVLLHAALRHTPHADLASRVRRKLAARNMDVAQRALWLGAGLIVSPKDCVPQVVDFLDSGREARGRHVVGFLAPDDVPPPSGKWTELNPRQLAMLVRALGGRYQRDAWVPKVGAGVRMMSAEQDAGMKVSGLVPDWVNRLAENADPAAGEALASLIRDPALETWTPVLSAARDRQAVVQRSATFRFPDFRAIREALRDGRPANAADLAALLVDRLEQLARQIRDGNTNDWRQYWDGAGRGSGSNKIQPKPRYENDCRDTLLSDLKSLLPEGVDAQPEGHYAEEKRADIRVFYGRHAIPVEIKKNSSSDLWSAINDQLVAKYVRDPESGGYGIYLVLWFGKDHIKTSPPAGRRPKTPKEMHRRLEAPLSPQQRRKIKVLVVDVSVRSPAPSPHSRSLNTPSGPSR